MSYNVTVFIGPYIQGPEGKKVSVNRTKYCCPKHDSKSFSDSVKFCPTCGTPLKRIKYKDTEYIRMYEVLDTIDSEDSFYMPDGIDDICLPNDNIPSQIDVNVDDSQIIDLSNKDIQKLKIAQKQWLVKNYKKEIALLKKEFGDKKKFLLNGV